MFEINTVVEHYKIIRQVGQGSYGTVYEVENIISNQKYALKSVFLQGETAKRELDAIRRYRDLRHPNLIQIYHVGIIDNILFYTMDWADDTFATHQVSSEELKESILQILDAIKLLHAHKLIHRDIKPDNILWIKGKAVLGDIGLLSHKSTVSFAGSPGFIPPMVWQGKELPNEYADLFALAKVIYCLISQCSLGEYPNYRGSRDASSSQLFNAVLAVCQENSKIKTVESFQDLLTQKIALPEKNSRKIVIILFLSIIIGIGIFLLALKFSKEKALPQKDNFDSKIVKPSEKIKGITPAKSEDDKPESTLEIKNVDDMYRELRRLELIKNNYPNEKHIINEKYYTMYTKTRKEIREEVDEVPSYKLPIKFADFYNKLSISEKNWYKSNTDILRSVINEDIFNRIFVEKYSETSFYRYKMIESKLESMEKNFTSLVINMQEKTPPSKLSREKVENSFKELQQAYKEQILILSKHNNG